MSATNESAAFAAVEYTRGFDIDAVLRAACIQLKASGVSLGGVVQEAAGGGGACAAAVHAIDLRSGHAFNIWDERGAGARGCRLNERGLIDVEDALLAAIADRVDLLVINRFGRAESLGRGLSGCFSAALAAAMPVITAVRKPYDEAWAHFHGGLATLLPANVAAIVNWHDAVTARFTGGPDCVPAQHRYMA